MQSPENMNMDSSQINRTPEDIEFERELFSGGVLNVDPDKYLEKEQEIIKNYPFATGDGEAFLIARSYHSAAKKEAEWLRKYNGQVPALWLDPIIISEDLRRAGKKNIQLSRELIGALLENPENYVQGVLALNQRLTIDQL